MKLTLYYRNICECQVRNELGVTVEVLHTLVVLRADIALGQWAFAATDDLAQAAAGTPNALFRLTPAELAAMTGGQVAQVKAPIG